MGCVARVYRPRDAEHTVLDQVVAEHLEAFLGAAAAAGASIQTVRGIHTDASKSDGSERSIAVLILVSDS